MEQKISMVINEKSQFYKTSFKDPTVKYVCIYFEIACVQNLQKKKKKHLEIILAAIQNFALFVSIISDKAMSENKIFKTCVYLFIIKITF